MAHYNLYESIGLDRRWSSEQLAAEISRRLNSGEAGNPGGVDELRVALGIFADPSRRARYDAILDDPSQPDLGISGLRRLAAGDVVGQVGPGGGDAAPGQPGQARQSRQPRQPQYVGRPGGQQAESVEQSSGAENDRPRGGRSGSWRTKLLVAAAVVVLVCLLVLGLVLWIARGGGSGGGKSEKLAEELIAQETDRDRVDWLREHYDEELARDIQGKVAVVPDADAVNDQYVDLAGSGSIDILGVEDYGPFLNVSLNVGGQPGMEGFESEYGVTAYDIVGLGDASTGELEVVLIFGERDGEWRLFSASAPGEVGFGDDSSGLLF